MLTADTSSLKRKRDWVSSNLSKQKVFQFPAVSIPLSLVFILSAFWNLSDLSLFVNLKLDKCFSETWLFLRRGSTKEHLGRSNFDPTFYFAAFISPLLFRRFYFADFNSHWNLRVFCSICKELSSLDLNQCVLQWKCLYYLPSYHNTIKKINSSVIWFSSDFCQIWVKKGSRYLTTLKGPLDAQKGQDGRFDKPAENTQLKFRKLVAERPQKTFFLEFQKKSTKHSSGQGECIFDNLEEKILNKNQTNFLLIAQKS